MTTKNTKARNFAFILYPESIPENFIENLEKTGIPMAISPLHNLDKTERKFKDMTTDEQEIISAGGSIYKKPHYHVLYIARNPVTVESIRKKIKRNLGDQSVSHIEIVDSVEYYFQYLTHESSDAIKKGKHRYDKKDLIFINDFDIDRYVTLDENEKKELRQTLLEIVDEYNIVNVKELSSFIRQRGNEFGIESMKYVNEIISSSSGIFRLYFDANYQCGYRPVYSKTIDPDTGEIKNERGWEHERV